MKKFVEPELRRIELKLTENIAASVEEYPGTFDNTYHTLQEVVDCNKVYFNTGIPTSTPLSKPVYIAIYDCLIQNVPMNTYMLERGL